MIKKLAISTIAATVLATSVSLPSLHAQAPAQPLNPQGTLKPEPFADVPPDHWAYNAVEFLRQQGLTEGYPDRTFMGKRPMTRYEFAQTLARMIPGILAKVQPAEGVTQEQLNSAIEGVKSQMMTPEQVREIVKEELAKQAPVAPGVTPEQLATLQRLVNEFRDELARLGVDVDSLKKQIADLTNRVDAIEQELARRPVLTGTANVIGKIGWKSPQTATAIPGVFRTVFDHDGRPLSEGTNALTPVLPYYDLDLGVDAHPTSKLRVGAVLNVGNYLSSYRTFHPWTAEGPSEVTPYKVFIQSPVHFFGEGDVTVGRQGLAPMSPYTFWAIDPDTYTYLAREDSGEIVSWGLNTDLNFGSAKFRAFAGVDPLDGRLLPINLYPDLGGLGTVLGDRNAAILSIRNFAGASLGFGSRVKPIDLLLPVGTATPLATRKTNAAVADEEETGLNFGPFRNMGLGLNWLIAAGDRSRVVEDANAQVYGINGQVGIGPIKILGEAAAGITSTGGVARPRALDADEVDAFDVRGYWNIGLGSFADLNLGGGWRRVETGYLVPGYWGVIGSWKNPRGIQGPLGEITIPFHGGEGSWLNNLALKGSAEFYTGDEDNPVTPVNEKDLHTDRYLAGLQFGLTSRDTVDFGWEQVFRNFLSGVAGGTFTTVTGGVAGSPLVGTRIKNTESYWNFGIGHNFTDDVAVKLLYQIVDYRKFTVDDSNQPANYRGYVATAQVGVRF